MRFPIIKNSTKWTTVMKMKTIQKNQKSVSMTHIQQVGMMTKQHNCITKIKGYNIFFIFFLLILSSSKSFSQVLPERYQKLIDSARIYRSMILPICWTTFY